MIKYRVVMETKLPESLDRKLGDLKQNKQVQMEKLKNQNTGCVSH